MLDLAVGRRGDEIERQPAMARLASFQHSGRVAAVEVRTEAAAEPSHACPPLPALQAGVCKCRSACGSCGSACLPAPASTVPRIQLAPTRAAAAGAPAACPQVADMGGGAMLLLAALQRRQRGSPAHASAHPAGAAPAGHPADGGGL